MIYKYVSHISYFVHITRNYQKDIVFSSMETELSKIYSKKSIYSEVTTAGFMILY